MSSVRFISSFARKAIKYVIFCEVVLIAAEGFVFGAMHLFR